MRRGAFLSAFLHLAIILIAFIGLPHLTEPPLDVGEAIPVEVVTLSDKTNIPPMAHKAPKPVQKLAMTPPAPPPLPEPPKLEPPKPVPPPPAPAPQATVAPPSPPQPPAPAPPAPPTPPQPPVAATAPAPPQPQAKAKPKPTPEPEAQLPPTPPTPPVPPTPRKQPPKPQPDQLASILKSVEQNQPPQPQQKPQPRQPELDRVLKSVTQTPPAPDQDEAQNVVQQFARPTQQATSLDQQLSMSEIDAVRRQIEGCWNIPAGAKDAKNLIVELHVQLNADGSVRAVAITDQSRLQSDNFFRAAAESAARAVYECAPLHLPADKYSQWQDMILNFDPSQIL
jgi:hypothetical protein